MKTVVAIILLLVISNIGKAQYYYTDLITTQQINKQYQLLKASRIQLVSAKSYEADNEPTEDLLLEQKISGNGSTITTTSAYPSTGKSISTSLYLNEKISKTTDSTQNIKSTTLYTYEGGNITSISTITEDVFMNNNLNETHIWIYENSQPLKMLLIKNNTDTTVIEFLKDEQGNIAEELWKKKGTTTEKYFFYYDDKHLLTDIVRFNIRAQRLLPEYLFGYSDAGTLIEFTQVPQGSADYMVWQYSYLANGLKQKELLYNKQKRLLGRVEYSYR